MVSRSDVLEVARVLREYARAPSVEALAKVEPAAPMGRAAKVYGELARRLHERPDVSAALKGAAFAPYFLVNGFILGCNLSVHADRAFLLDRLSAGLVEFADYLLFVANRLEPEAPAPTPEEEKALLAAQTRYFAYCVAQIGECGMGVDGVFMTMKGDSVDQGSSYAVRDLLEGGPDAIEASPLYTDDEKKLWLAVYAAAPDEAQRRFEALQQHLVSAHRLPFLKSPTGWGAG